MNTDTHTNTNSNTASYRGMDRSALDAAYDNRGAMADFPGWSARREQRCTAVRAARRPVADLRYGDGPRERLDYFAANTPNAPVLVFIHGGYWQANDKETSSALVEGPLSRGFAVVLLEYTLAPEAGIGQMVQEIDRALTWLGAHVAELGGDPARMLLSGHSAGGHLTAMLLTHPAVAGALAISGLFDLEPIRLGSLNDKLGLDADAVQRYSPALHLPASCPPLIVTVGTAELPELQRQSAEYAAAMQAAGLPVQFLPLAGCDHFTILDALSAPDGALCRALSELAGAGVTQRS